MLLLRVSIRCVIRAATPLHVLSCRSVGLVVLSDEGTMWSLESRLDRSCDTSGCIHHSVLSGAACDIASKSSYVACLRACDGPVASLDGLVGGDSRLLS